MAGTEFIRDLAVVMLAAGVAGWICQRIGLSLVVGYLAAGAVIGPYTTPIRLIADTDRVQLLSQIGLVFLIFSIGVDLGLQRLKRLGLSIAVATVVGAILVYHGCRLFGLALGWSETQSFFLAGILMVSSSAIVSKVLQELNATHEPAGQLALGLTVMDDPIAVVMLTLLSALAHFGGAQAPSIAQTVASFGAFIAFLLVVTLLFVPRLLLRLTKTGTAEIRTIIVVGLLFMLAWLADRAGYSLALGAFLIGVIVGSTPQKPEIERVFEGARDMFGAVFFVATGMLVDFSLLKEVWLLVLAVAALTFFLRAFGAAAGLTLAGNTPRDSIRAGLAVTPLGEFSFIIAQLGVTAGVIPKTFYPLAVGVSIITAIGAPVLIRQSNPISGWIDHRLPLFLKEWIAFYHSWLHRLAEQQQRNLLWKLSSPRILKAGAHMIVVSAVLAFAKPLYGAITERYGEDLLVPHGISILFWGGLGLLLLGPIIAIWRNLEAAAMIAGEAVTAALPRRQTLQPVLETILKVVSLGVILLWLLALLPFGESLIWSYLTVALILTLLAALFRARLVRFHSRLEIELKTQLQTAFGERNAPSISTLLEERQKTWSLKAVELALPDFAAAAGQKILEFDLRRSFGCSIASIDRNGVLIPNPSGQMVLYPQDKLLLVGPPEQIESATEHLCAVRRAGEAAEQEDFSLETVLVPPHSEFAGRTLLNLDLIRRFNVQIAGIRRGEQRITTPSGEDRLEAGDELLVLGERRKIQEFAAALEK